MTEINKNVGGASYSLKHHPESIDLVIYKSVVAGCFLENCLWCLIKFHSGFLKPWFYPANQPASFEQRH